MATVLKTKMAGKDLGDPSDVKKGDAARLYLGVIGGVADKVTERKAPNGEETFYGLGGLFRAVPAANGADTVESGIVYLPEAFHNMIASQVAAKDADGKSINSTVRFAFRVFSEKAKNPQGYSWVYEPLLEPAANNPLDELFGPLQGKLALPSPDQVKAAQVESAGKSPGKSSR